MNPAASAPLPPSPPPHATNPSISFRLARLEYLMERRPELLSSVVLRQNPHNVAEWHKRVRLFQGRGARGGGAGGDGGEGPPAVQQTERQLTKQILTYTEAVRF